MTHRYVDMYLAFSLLMVHVRFFFFFSSRRRHTRCALVTGVQTCALPICRAQRQARVRVLEEDLLVVGLARAARRVRRGVVEDEIGRASCRERVCQYV